MDDNVKFRVPLFIDDFDDIHAIKKEVEKIILANQNNFHPIFERVIDQGDAGLTVMEGSLYIEDCCIDNDNMGGMVNGTFDSDYYASCKDMRSQGEHEVTIEFTIEGDYLIFDIALPIAWKPDDYM